ncbi:TetR/AcrR family transcriptional regulator [Rhabdothermincola sp.]|uniref:TetR/AcrR family transcriptional regulator n=1 Tax=Rhabdothermincola sp. TaxID=2820405 RepID=UPI002FDF355E
MSATTPPGLRVVSNEQTLAAESVVTDGRRLRGGASRRALLDAATAVLVDRGVGALTHRAVAERAGVPLARVSYHFPTVEDLMVAAAGRYVADFDERLRRMAAAARSGRRSVVEACTDFLYELVTDGAGEFLAVVEVRLALRRRGRRVEADGVLGVIRSFGVGDEQAASIAASMFGFAVLAATEASPPARSQVRSFVRTVLEGR